MKKGSLSFFQNRRINNAISIESNGFKFYAISDGNTMNTLCLYGINTNNNISKSIDEIQKFMSENDLFLVDWVYRKYIDANEITDYIKTDN